MEFEPPQHFGWSYEGLEALNPAEVGELLGIGKRRLLGRRVGVRVRVRARHSAAPASRGMFLERVARNLALTLTPTLEPRQSSPAIAHEKWNDFVQFGVYDPDFADSSRLRRGGQGRELRFPVFSTSVAVRERFLAHCRAVWRFADPM